MSCIQHLEIALPTSSRLAFGAGLFLMGLLLGGAPQSGKAQGTFRADVLNVPPVLSSPYVSDLEQNVRQGRYAVQLTYSNANGDRVQARLRLTVRHEGEQVLQTTSQPASFQPGTYTYRTFDELPELLFEKSAGDLFDQLRARLGDKVARSGTLPEGEYTIEAEPLLADPAAPVSPVPGTAVTTVRYPQPPQLVDPADQSTVPADLPVFLWTPVNGTGDDVFEYELLIAEVLPGQTPLQAIEANRLVTGQEPVTLRQRTSFPYTQELPPLQEGATYAWQVRARETTQGVPLSDDGESEIYTFTYGSSESQYEAPELVSPVDEAVPDISALRFQWYEAEGPRADENEDYRELYQRLILARKQEGQSPESALDGEPVLEETYSFGGGNLQDKPYPTDATPLTEGTYAWTVQLVGETEEGEEVLASSSAMPFTVEAEETPPPVAGGTIQLTRYASLVGTDNLERQDDTFNGRAQLALDLGGTEQAVRLPAQVHDLTATPNEAGALVARAGNVASTQLDSSLPVTQISGFNLEAIRWGEDPDSLHVEATLSLHAPFNCEDASIELPETAFTLLPNGMLQGTVSTEGGCRVPLGSFEAVSTRTTLRVGQSSEGQVAHLRSEADLVRNSEVLASGRLEADLMTGELQTLRFTVDEPFEWGLPSDDPVLTFRVQRAHVDRNGLMMDGRNRLLLPGGNDVRATFDSLNVGFESGRIQSGRVVFDTGFAFEAGMDPDGTNLTYRAVPAGTDLTASPGLLFTLADTTVLNRTGLSSSGTASAQLNVDDWAPDLALQGDFSEQFAMGLSPVGIQRGQVTLSYEGASIGYVDEDGFHADPSQLVAAIPEKLPLPNEKVAYLRLKRNGTPLVTLTQQSGGRATLQTKPGETLDLVVPAVDSTTVSAQINNLRVTTRGGFDYQSGSVTATVQGGPRDLTDQDLPLYLTEIRYGSARGGNTSRTGLFLKGNLALFGTDTGSDGSVTLAMDQNGAVSGRVALSSIGKEISMAGSGKVALTVDSVDGSVNVPAAGSPHFDLAVGGSFTLQDGNTDLASADLGLRFTDRGLSVIQVSTTSNLQTPPLSVGNMGLDVSGISSVKQLSYSEQNGFGFRVGLDLDLQVGVPAGSTMTVPLKGVEVFRDAQTGNGGFELPSQILHASTKPALDAQQTVSVDPIELRLFNVNLTRDVTFDWFNAPQSLASALSALEMDLGIRVKQVPSLAGKELNIYGAGLTDGVFTGQIETYTYQSGQEPTVALGNTAGIQVDSIQGGLTNQGTAQSPAQGINVEVHGTMDLPDAFANAESPDCPPMTVSAEITEEGGVSGQVSNFAACGNVAFGPATLTFPSSTLSLAYQGGSQSATLDGQARATIQGVNDTLSATGSARYDLVDGQLLSSSLTFTGAFDYGLPQSDPFFTFRVQQADLTSAGLRFTGSGSLQSAQNQRLAGVRFNQLTVHPDSSIVSGSATIQSNFGIEVDLQQGQPELSVIQASAPTPQDPALRITLPASLTIDKDGLEIGGSSTASLNFNQDTYASLTADFKPLHLGLDPVEVDSGRVDFTTQGGTRVAYYDSDGFTFDAAGVAVASVPKKLGLPTTDVAYLKLRDDQDNELIEYQPASGGGHEFSSKTDASGNPQPVKLVLAAVDSKGTSPTFDITIPDSDPLVVDDAFQTLKSGTIRATVNEPLTTNYDLPLRLQTLVYEKDNTGAYALTADGTVDLPEGLGGEAVSFSDLGFSSNGPSGTITAGTYSGSGTATGTCSDVPSSLPSQPLASAAYKNGSIQANASGQQLQSADLAVRLQGVRLNLDPSSSNDIAVVGDVTSRVLTDPTASSQGAPDDIAFAAGYGQGSWTAGLCTGRLPSDSNGDKKISLEVADLYLDDNVGTGVRLEVRPNATNLTLSGTARFPDVLGSNFAVTVQDLTVGTAGVTVGQAAAGTGGQSFRLFSGELKVQTDARPQGFNVSWDSQADALALSMSGDLWLTAYMDPNKPSDAVQFNNLSVNTSGDVSLGSASGNLLASETLAIVGGSSGPDTTMTLDELRLKKPQGTSSLALTMGGRLNLPDLMDGVSSSYGLTLDTDGNITSSSPLRARFVSPSGSNDQVDKIGDNSRTEIGFGDVATMDVKEVGVNFVNDQIRQPAVYANGATYIQPDGNQVDDLVRFGSLGSSDASGAGFYYKVGTPPSFNATAQVDQFDLFGFLTLSDMSVGVQKEGGTRKVVLGGTVGVNLENAGSASGHWKELKISRTGIADRGHLAGDLSLTLVDVVTLELNSLDYGEGQFSQGDSTVTADTYFKLTGASITLPEDLGKGGIDAAYYYTKNGGSQKALQIYGAQVELKEMATAKATMVYEKRELRDELKDKYEKDIAVKLFVAGYAEVSGQELTLAGAFESTGGNVRYGFFASVKSDVGIPVAPGVTITKIGGGFFYRPRAKWVDEVRNNAFTSKANLIPDPSDADPSGLTFAAYINGGALVGGVDAEVLIEATDQHTSLYGAGNLKGLEDFVGVGMRLSVYYGSREGVDGAVNVLMNNPPTVNGEASLNFQAYKNRSGNDPSMHWLIEGKVGKGDKPVWIQLIYEASGQFFASDDGLLLKELEVKIGTPDLGVINVNAGATVSFWHVPKKALGAYAKIGVHGELFNGTAEVGANLKGAYIRKDDLIYAAAQAYVRVLGVHEEEVGLWGAIKEGNVEGGKGTKEKYDDMIADAQQRAQEMIAQAKNAMEEMRKLEEPGPPGASDEALTEAGVNAIDPESGVNGQSILSSLKNNEDGLLKSSAVNGLTYGLDQIVAANDKPSPQAAAAALSQAQSKRQTANTQRGAVESHLQSLTAKQIRWTNEASRKLSQMDRSSPIGNVQSAQYTGSGDKKRMTRSPSWTIDEQKARQQSQALSDLKEEIDKLNEQYRKSLADVAANVRKANELFEAKVSTGQSQTTISDLAGTYADAARERRKYHAERASYLWTLSSWASTKHSNLTSRVATIKPALTIFDYSDLSGKNMARKVSSLFKEKERMTVTRHAALKNLVPDMTPRGDSGLPTKETVENNLSDSPDDTYLTWGEQLWYDIFDLALPEIESGAAEDADSLGRYTPGNQGPQAHADFTRQIDKAYTAKNQLLTTYYGMVESYRGWRQDKGLTSYVLTFPDDGGASSQSNNGGGNDGFVTMAPTGVYEEYDVVLSNRLDSLERVLEPPQINDITVTRSQAARKAKADISVSATHAERVVETSYQIQRGTGGSVHTTGDLYSIGDQTSFTLHSFAEQENQQTQNFTVLVRARGAGGATLSQRANFAVAVGGQGTNTAPDRTVDDALESDSTAPEKVQITWLGNTRVSSSLQGSISTDQIIQNANKTVWTNSATALRVKAEAEDSDSDIAGIEYKIGTSKGADDVREWTDLQGQSTTGGSLMRQFTVFDQAAVSLDGVVRGLQLAEGKEYYVSIRARNGAGLKTVYEHSNPVIYDGTPPSPPQRANNEVDEGATPSSSSGFLPTASVVHNPPSWSGMSPSAGQPTPPSLTVRWKAASDDTSGLRDYYEYVVTRDTPDKPFLKFSDNEALPKRKTIGSSGGVGVNEISNDLDLGGPKKPYSKKITGNWLSYTDSVYVHVRATDKAGNKSDPLTIGPLLPTDPSFPRRATVHPMVVPDGVRLYVKRPSYDQESGIDGYKYKIENENTGNIVKSYPSGDSTDVRPLCPQSSGLVMPAGMILQSADRPGPEEWMSSVNPMGCTPASNVNTAPYTLIQKDGLPTGVPLSLTLKAVNGQGRSTVITATNRFTLDDSAPTFSAEASRTTGSSDVQVSLTNVHDPETGIAGVEVRPAGTRGYYARWTEAAAPSNRPTSPQSYTTTTGQTRQATTTSPPDSVKVRVTNGTGQQTVKTVSVMTFPSIPTGQQQTNWGTMNVGY
jgi:hypothetical protein